jgi:hypothetical protein
MVGGRWLALIYNSINSHTISSSDIGIDFLVCGVLLIILTMTPQLGHILENRGLGKSMGENNIRKRWIDVSDMKSM